MKQLVDLLIYTFVDPKRNIVNLWTTDIMQEVVEYTNMTEKKQIFKEVINRVYILIAFLV